MGRDYYQILGVERGATAEQLKAAYKKQAVKWHPDKNLNQREAAEERFKLVAGNMPSCVSQQLGLAACAAAHARQQGDLS